MGKASWGTVKLPGIERVEVLRREQNAPPIRTNPETTRIDRQGTRQLKLQTLDGGLGVRRGSESSKDISRIRYSDGPWSHIFGGLFLPPVATTQSNLVNENISASRAANIRLHALNTTLGQSKLRFHVFVKDRHLRSTSDSNPALADAATVMTDNVAGVFEGKANSTRYVIVCYDAETNDVSVIADPTASPPTLATLFALSAGDGVRGGWYSPNLGPGFMGFYGKIGGTNGLWYLGLSSALTTAPNPLVLTPTKDILGSLANLNTGAESANGFVNITNITGSSDINMTGTAWTNPTNASASDDSKATSALDAGNSQGLAAVDFGFNIPSDAIIRGVLVEIEKSEAAAADNITDEVVSLCTQIRIGGAGATVNEYNAVVVGTNKADTSTEWPVTASEAYVQYGGASDLWGGELTPSIINSGDFGVVVQADGGNAGAIASIDHIRMTVYYTQPGTQAVIPAGGFVLGPDPLNPNVIYIVAPEFQDEVTTVNVPRILWKVTEAYDSEYNRPTVTIEKVPTLLSHVEGGCFALNGVVVFGDNSSGIGKTMVRIDTQTGEVHNLLFQAQQGFTEDWGIVNAWGADRFVVADVALEDASIVQTMVCFDAKWSALGPRESIAAFPLAYAEAAPIDINQRYRHRIYPNTTQLNNTYAFQQRNLSFDPTRAASSIVKHNGVLTAQTPTLDALGPEEAVKVLLNAWNLSREVSSTNTIRLRYSIDDAASWTTWATFTAFASKSALSTPILFRQLTLEIGLDHTASSTGTPSGLPILIEGIAQWLQKRQYKLYFNPEDALFRITFGPGGIDKMYTDLYTLQETLPVQTLLVNGQSVKATWTDFISEYEPGSDPAIADSKPTFRPQPWLGHSLTFDEVV